MTNPERSISSRILLRRQATLSKNKVLRDKIQRHPDAPVLPPVPAKPDSPWQTRKRVQARRDAAVNDSLAGRRSPPHDANAERGSLAAIAWSPTARELAFEQLEDRHFYLPQHQHLFKAMLQLHTEGKPLDALIIKDRLHTNGVLVDAGGADYVDEVLTTETSGLHIGEYIEIILNQSIARRLYYMAQEIIADVHEGGATAPAVLERVANETMKIGLDQIKDYQGIGQSEMWDEAERVANGELMEVMPSGFNDVDRLMDGGYRKGEVVIVAARPSVGKTTFATNILLNLLTNTNYRILMMSLEQRPQSVTGKMYSMLSGCPNRLVRTRAWIGSQHEKQIQAARDQLTQWEQSGRLWIEQVGGITAQGIESKVKRYCSNPGLDVVIVDYLQLICGSAKGESAATANVQAASNALKRLSLNANVCMILLSQLNRGPMDTLDKEPQLHHLKQSGAIEQDADVVQMLWRAPESLQPANPDLPERLYLKVSKNREGATCFGNDSFVIDFNKNTQRMLQGMRGAVKGSSGGYGATSWMRVSSIGAGE